MATPFKMKGWSPFTQKTDHPPKESPPEHKDLDVTAGESSRLDAKINDIENRIEFLRADIKTGTISAMEGGKKLAKLKKALALLK